MRQNIDFLNGKFREHLKMIANVSSPFNQQRSQYFCGMSTTNRFLGGLVLYIVSFHTVLKIVYHQVRQWLTSLKVSVQNLSYFT